ncbi:MULTISPECIES: hypothetical protein [unclassified Streptomyces]|uniref:hypothetical protein n=1 Tax=unclassified Streptomyces TaxID=2593676 RepID=UPI003815B738
MRRDGGTDARQIGGAGDNGADVLATDPMAGPGSSSASTERPVTAGLRSAPRTCSGSTGPPVSSTARHRPRRHERPVLRALRTPGCSADMHLADRRSLAAWASGGQPLWELLSKIPGPRKSR